MHADDLRTMPMKQEEDARAALIRLLAEHAYQEGEFVLASGKTASFYLDAKQVSYRGNGARLVGEAVLDLIDPYDVEAVGGMTLGADAIVASTVVASAARAAAKGGRAPLDGFIVRKEAKGHGLGKYLEGVSPEGRRVAVVEDVVTTGGSALEAVERIREVGAEVVVAVTLVDREQGGAEAFAEAGIPLHAVATISEIREVLSGV